MINGRRVMPDRKSNSAAEKGNALSENQIKRNLECRIADSKLGAESIKKITGIFDRRTVEGGVVGYRPGAKDSILRHEKRFDVMCVLQERRELHRAIERNPDLEIT